MAIALLATGDEIIQGDTLNSNGHYLAKTLSSEGLPVGLHMACSDSELEIHDCIEFLAKQHDIIIITGGLGPTSDDRTRFALGRFMQEGLVEFPEAINHIEQRLLRGKLAFTSGNKQQALFPQCAQLLANPNGTAMGCYCHWQNKLLILLPGPPRECLPMFNDFVLPLLQQSQHSEKVQLKWRVFGVAEAQIAQQLDDALQTIDCETGYRLETPYVECKVRCTPNLINQVEAIVEPIIQPHIIATVNKKASELLKEKFECLNMPVVIDDEVTGGILQTLVQAPSNIQWVKFNSNAPENSIYFRLSGLQEYWSNCKEAGTTKIIIDYLYNNQQGQESHELPYRSSMVVYSAAEWLSFRLFHLVDQLHQGMA